MSMRDVCEAGQRLCPIALMAFVNLLAASTAHAFALPSDWTLAKEVAAADLIVVGRVVRQDTELFESSPYSNYTIAVDQLLKGKIEKNVFSARVPGGKYIGKNGREIQVDYGRELHLHERYILFLKLGRDKNTDTVAFVGRSPYWLRRNPVTSGVMLWSTGGPLIVGIADDNWVFDLTRIPHESMVDPDDITDAKVREQYAMAPAISLPEVTSTLQDMIQRLSESPESP